MKIAVAAETEDTRVAATPDVVKRYVAAGAEVAIETGAGTSARVTDEAFRAAGAKIVGSAAEAVRDADIVLCVRRPTAETLAACKKGAIVVGALDPFGDRAALQALADSGVAAVAMELMPRITRAQSMDILSSQANLAGYQAVIDAAAVFDRAFPMMMTAAGTVAAAKVFVMGAGVAGLQAIATARRLGAQVSATDVRPAAKEQVGSLGAKFIAVENDEFRQAETAAGYAKEMSAEYRKAQGELVAAHVAKQDIVITTALIPGRPAPKLVTAAMVASMQPGSVIVDLAVERGGNVEGAKPGEVVTVGPTTIVGYNNVPGRIAATASLLYAKNLFTFVDMVLIDKAQKSLAPKWEDELMTATLLTRDGALVNKMFSSAASAPGAPGPSSPGSGATSGAGAPAVAAGPGRAASGSGATPGAGAPAAAAGPGRAASGPGATSGAGAPAVAAGPGRAASGPGATSGAGAPAAAAGPGGAASGSGATPGAGAPSAPAGPGPSSSRGPSTFPAQAAPSAPSAPGGPGVVSPGSSSAGGPAPAAKGAPGGPAAGSPAAGGPAPGAKARPAAGEKPGSPAGARTQTLTDTDLDATAVNGIKTGRPDDPAAAKQKPASVPAPATGAPDAPTAA